MTPHTDRVPGPARPAVWHRHDGPARPRPHIIIVPDPVWDDHLIFTADDIDPGDGPDLLLDSPWAGLDGRPCLPATDVERYFLEAATDGL